MPIINKICFLKVILLTQTWHMDHIYIHRSGDGGVRRIDVFRHNSSYIQGDQWSLNSLNSLSLNFFLVFEIFKKSLNLMKIS
jgi:hypothetical protein